MPNFKTHLLDFDQKNFIKTHFIFPFLIFISLITWIELNNIDVIFSQNFYDTQLKQWPYKDNWLISTVFHSYGGKVTKILMALMFVVLLITRIKKSFNHYTLPMAFLFITSVIGPCIIIFLKNKTHIYCPWDLTLFGGLQPYIHLFDHTNDSLKIGHCFPAAHASGGFTFMSFYFFFILLKPHYKYYGLAFGLLMGLIYGFSQQMRGAHFLSHDLFSAAICWFTSVLLFFLLLNFTIHYNEADKSKGR